MSFVIEIDGSRLFRGRIPVDDHEIVVEKGRAVYCRGVVRVIFSDQDLLLHVWCKRKPPRSLAWFSYPHPLAIQTCNASQSCSLVDCSALIGSLSFAIRSPWPKVRRPLQDTRVQSWKLIGDVS